MQEDYFLHMITSAAIGFVAYSLLVDFYPSLTLTLKIVTASIISLGAGLGKELIQWKEKGFFDCPDMLFNCFGITIFLIIIVCYYSKTLFT